MSLVRWIDFTSVSDDRGQLVAAEVDRHIPFPIKRVYYLLDLKRDEPRGYHAHKALRQVAVCVQGSCTFVLDDGFRREEIVLADPGRGLSVDPMIWHEMSDFSADCVMLVFASDVYDEADYIRDYENFVRGALS
jgi:dTDP-4-dehydrorhamnose 3,5-epimerase-like enzyme